MSCILGIEIVSKTTTKENEFSANDAKSKQNSTFMDCRLLVDKATLKKNSAFLEQIHQQICKNYGDLEMELNKHYNEHYNENKALCGITMGGNKLHDWAMFSNYKKKMVSEISSFKKEHGVTEDEVVTSNLQKSPIHRPLCFSL